MRDNDNDEIAVAPPLWIDDGDGPAELLVAFGRKLHCFDGETGAPTDVSTPWEDPVSLPHRTWPRQLQATWTATATSTS